MQTMTFSNGCSMQQADRLGNTPQKKLLNLLKNGIKNKEREEDKMKYRVIFSMCHCESTEVELDEEDLIEMEEMED